MNEKTLEKKETWGEYFKDQLSANKAIILSVVFIANEILIGYCFLGWFR